MTTKLSQVLNVDEYICLTGQQPLVEQTVFPTIWSQLHEYFLTIDPCVCLTENLLN